jgi:putative transcription factor
MSYADWDPVILDKRGRRAPGESKDSALARAARTGAVSTELRHDAVSNKASAGAGISAKKLDDDMDTFARTWSFDPLWETAKHVAGSARITGYTCSHLLSADATVGHSLQMAIQQARLAKKMTQKELAVAICEKPTIIAEYESGRAIPNPALLLKLDRALGVHLPRPPKKK